VSLSKGLFNYPLFIQALKS